METLRYLGDALIDRDVDELIGALGLAFVAGLVVASLHRLLQRRVANPTMLITSLVMAANLACVMYACGYLLVEEKRQRGELSEVEDLPDPYPHRDNTSFQFLASFLVEKMADDDADGRLSATELRSAANRLIGELPFDEEGEIDPSYLGWRIQRSLGPTPPPPTASGWPVHSRGPRRHSADSPLPSDRRPPGEQPTPGDRDGRS